MREIFHREREELGDHLVEMGRKVAEAVDHAGRALREADLELAQAVIDADNRIDELEDQIEHMSLTMLARQQPVATDLRLVVSALRLSATLERMGDLARNIASIARSRYPDVASSGPMLDALTEMSHAASDITHMLLALMENHDIALVGRIARRVAEETIQLHGGIGMTEEYALAPMARRLLAADARFGDSDHHLERFIEATAA